jgi:hypothetical protein
MAVSVYPSAGAMTLPFVIGQKRNELLTLVAITD